MASSNSHAQHTHLLEVVLAGNVEDCHIWPPAYFQDVDIVLHVASPVTVTANDDEKEILQPAINGTLNMLRAAVKHGPQVKTFVYTSSMAAIMNSNFDPSEDRVYSAEDWSSVTYEDGMKGYGLIAYVTSKTESERAAFRFIEQEKPKFFFVSIVPPVMIGAYEQPGARSKNILQASNMTLGHMDGSLDKPAETTFPAFVHVKDPAEAHVNAIERPGAVGKRYSLAAGTFQWTDVCSITKEEFSGLAGQVHDPKKTLRKRTYGIDGGSAVAQLGIEYRGIRQAIRDTVRSLKAME